MSRPARSHTGVRYVLVAVAALALVATSGGAVSLATAAEQPAVAGQFGCESDDDAAVFRTDSGLEVAHDGRSLRSNPFVDETTLSFPNVTVAASDDASLRVTSATDRRVCLADVRPTNVPVEVNPAAGPRVVVADDLETFAYGPITYERAATQADLSYSSRTTARVTVTGTDLQAGHGVEAVDAETRSLLTTATAAEDGSLELRLPAGSGSVDLRLANASTETESPSSGNDGGSSDGRGSDATPSPATERTPNESATSFGAPTWTDELVEYEPTPQTQHVGGFLPVTVLLWVAALWLLLARRDRTVTPLAAALVAASVRATSDLLQVTLDGFAGVETSLAAVNLLLELSVAVLFAQFAVVYAGERPDRVRYARWGLAAVGFAGTVTVLTNPIHGLVFTDAAVVEAPFTYVSSTLGPAGWALYALDGGLVVGAGWLVLRSVLGAPVRTVWRPVAVIGAGLGFAVFLGVASLLDAGPVAGYDYTASGVNYFVLLTTGALLAHGLKRLKTSGEKSVVDDLEDATVILDDAWTVVEHNPAAERVLPDIGTGRPFDDVMPERIARPTVGQPTTTELSLPAAPETYDGSEGERWSEGSVPTTDGGRDAAGTTSDGDGAESEGASQGWSWGDPLSDVTDRADDGEPADERNAARSASNPEPAERDPAPADEDRDHRHYLVTASTVSTETDVVIGYTVRLADVTDLKRQVLRLEAKNDALDRFAEAVTQDLRRPLARATDATDEAVAILESAAGPGSVDRSRLSAALRGIDEALDRMAAVIEDVLDLARGAEVDVDPQRVAFEDAVADAWEPVDPAGATLQVETGGELTADVGHLRDLLAALFRNSVDHAGPGVTICAGLTESGFYVADDGPGVPAAVRDDLFDVGVTTDEHGSGLGLAVARQRADAHGWEIGLDATADGARFVVTGCDAAPERDGSQEGRR